MESNSEPTCYSCGAVLDLPAGAVGRGEECHSCRADVRVCRNCQRFDSRSYNECSEPMADRVVDKEKRNFCDYFQIGTSTGASGADSSKDEALKKLDDLFKK